MPLNKENKSNLDYEMLTSPDTLQLLLTAFAFMAWNTALKSMVFDLLGFAWLLRFL